jgi:hypothetical protein
MDTNSLNSDKLAKLLALASSSNDAEALSALRKASGMLKSAGMSFTDVAAKMKAPAPQPVQTGQPAPSARDIFAGFDDYMEAKEPGWKAKCAAERMERERQLAERKAAVIAKYGSVEAAVARDAREQVLHDAARPWLRGPNKPTNRSHLWLAGRWHKTMDGWDGHGFGPDAKKKPGPECCAALDAALPLPRTIREAHDEYRYWRERDDEIGLVLDCYGDEQLDLPAAYRLDRVRDLLETVLRASNLDDVLIRQRYLVDRESSMPEVEKAVLADLEHLARMQAAPPAPVQNGREISGAGSTARARRAEVLRLLSNMDTAGLSDREIARRVGVSPQTVGNIRRRNHP